MYIRKRVNDTFVIGSFWGGAGWNTEPVSEANDLTEQIVICHTNDMHGILKEGSGKFSIE